MQMQYFKFHIQYVGANGQQQNADLLRRHIGHALEHDASGSADDVI
jgi:hypothetical protein